MLVISDASPINILIRIELTHLLPTLFGRIVIPGVVANELGDSRAPAIVRQFIDAAPSWLEILSPQTVRHFPRLDPGEEAAINLAHELKADLLLVDDKRARSTAAGVGLNIIGTLGILEMASRRGLDDPKVAVHKLKNTDFRVSA